MTAARDSLSARIREIRRRHYGPQGGNRFAAALHIPLEELDRYERGAIPAGDMLLRMCELTGEDLQWLLTGFASRAMLEISAARARHETLLGRIAALLDEQPQTAPLLEALLESLTAAAPPAPAGGPPAATGTADVIPLIRSADLPETLRPAAPHRPLLPESTTTTVDRAVCVREIAEGAATQPLSARLLTYGAPAGDAVRALQFPAVARALPDAFAVEIADESMAPDFAVGDMVIVAPGAAPRIGLPALCRCAAAPLARVRVWLGADARQVELGRRADGARETLARADFCWALEVLYHVARAAA